MKSIRYFIGCMLVVIGALWIVGCAENPKTLPQPSSPQVRTDSDRFFDKMKQDEQDRGVRR